MDHFYCVFIYTLVFDGKLPIITHDTHARSIVPDLYDNQQKQLMLMSNTFPWSQVQLIHINIS